MPPTVTRRSLELAGLSVPLVEVTGSHDGPLLSVIAGVHGCEYASMAGVRRWLRGLETRDISGRVRAVPVLNVSAFAARTPFLVPEDGKNLNRCFPGDPAGTLAERLAYDAFMQVITGSDAYIDAHCGDMVEALQPFALYEAGPAEDSARDLAIAYQLPYVIRQVAGPDRAVSGTSSGAAAAAGIPAITAEAGECGLVQEHAVAMHVAGLNGVLELLGMADESQGAAAAGAQQTQPEQTELSRFLWLRCRDAGWWEPAVGAGAAVRSGQVIGTVSTLDGAQVMEEIIAPADGVIIFLTSSPAVAADGLLFGLGAR
ncbi:MAG TPA: succinylglutamate desuccinylase/aspartoacylase family protein [Streptosporangiaceae bacterium]|nr:succinylglutamate desuccinylase/aspartoacylase family protein [Streptosporangiaceae bacterium]